MDVPEIDIATTVERIAAGAAIVDVRQPEEYAEAHVAGAPLIPLAEVPERVDEFPGAGEVLIICRSGNRSGRAAQFLRAQGIDAINVAGGMLAWIDAGHDVVTGDGLGA